MIFTKIVGALMCVGGILNAGRKINKLEEWLDYKVGLAISLGADLLLVTVGIALYTGGIS